MSIDRRTEPEVRVVLTRSRQKAPTMGLPEGADRLACQFCGAHNRLARMVCTNCGKSLVRAERIPFLPPRRARAL